MPCSSRSRTLMLIDANSVAVSITVNVCAHKAGEQSVNSPQHLPLAGPQCWPAGLALPMPRESAEELSKLFKAVADPARLQILALVGAADQGEMCACDFTDALGLSQPTVSHHLRILTEAGLLTRSQRGTWAWFTMNRDRLQQLAAALQAPATPSMGVTS